MTADVASSPSHNSLLSFGTPTASSRIVFDALRKDLEDRDENAGSSGSSSSSPSSSPAKSSPARPLNMSPSRKAILDRFANINKGPPPMAPSSRSTAGPALGDASMSLLNMSSSRAGPNSSIADYDIMGAPDDSLLIKARQMGDESFDRRLLKGGSPEKREALRKKVQARASMAPQQQQTAIERKSSPAKLQGQYPQQGNALGLGLPSSPAKNETRSFSTLSDTSNLFEEQGEQSLLYASMRVKPGSEKGKLLGALAATPRQQPAAPLRSMPTSSAKPTKLATALGAGPSKAVGAATSSAQRIGGVTGRVLPPSTPSSTMTTPRARPATIARRSTTAATPRATGTTPSSSSSSGSSSASLARTARPIGVAATPLSRTTGSVTPRATPSSATPRSRPPLNASAARLRRLSGLPQLMDDDGNVKGKASAAAATPGSAASAAVARSSAIPQQQRPRSSIATATGRPSLASGKALSSPRATHIARQAPGSAVKATSSRITASPSTSKIAGAKARPISMYAGSAASQRPSQPSPSRSTAAALSGQLPPRRAPPTSISPPAANSHLPALSSTRKPPRPFLLGWGTNHTINGDSPTLQGDAPLPEEGEGGQGEKRTTVSPRKSIATSTLMQAPSASRPVTGLPKSTSMGCVASATPGSTTSSCLPISRLARPSTATSRLPARAPGSTPAPAPQLASSPPPAQSTTSLARSGSLGGGAGPRQRSSSGFWKYNKTPTPPMGEERELPEE